MNSIFKTILIFGLLFAGSLPVMAQDFGRQIMEIGHIAVDASDPKIIQRTNGRSRTDQIIWMFKNINRLERDGQTITGFDYEYRMVFTEGSEWSGTNNVRMPDGTVWKREGRIWTSSGVAQSGMVRITVPRNAARDAVNLCVEINDYTMVVGKIVTNLPTGEERRCSPESFNSFVNGRDWREGFGFPLRLLPK